MRRLIFLKSVLEVTYGMSSRDADPRITFVAMESANTWGGYCRAFYLGCAMGVRDGSGAKLLGSQRFRSEADALLFAIQVMRPGASVGSVITRRDEPDWHQASTFLKVMNALAPPNVGTVNAALSLATDPLPHLQTFRNFYAHRNDETVQRAQNLAPGYGVAATAHPTTVLRSRPPGRSETVLGGWLADRTVIIELMT